MRISPRILSRRMSYLRHVYAIHKVSMLIAMEMRDIRIDIVLAISCKIMQCLECTVSGCPSYTSIPDTARQVSFLDCYYSVTVIVQL